MNSANNIGKMIELADIESVIDELGCEYRLTTGRSGDQINIKECPRCGGHRWKVFLNAETGVGNCFHGSCVGEKGFTLFSFARYVLGTNKDVFELLERYSSKVGWMPKKKSASENRNKYKDILKNKDHLLMPNSVELPYRNSIGKYLKSRGFTENTVKYLKLRYCKSGYFEYDSPKGTRRQDYSKRIIIPIYDMSGAFVSFQGRDVTGEAEKKYLFPPGLPGTSLYLYNGDNAVGHSDVIINEGVFDVAAVHQALSNDPTMKDVIPIATFGKVLSHGRNDGEDQLGALFVLKQNGLKEVTMMWDSEPKTIRDMSKAAKLISEIGLKVRIAVLPKGCDPNEVDEFEVRKAYRKAYDVSNKMKLLKFLTINTAI